MKNTLYLDIGNTTVDILSVTAEGRTYSKISSADTVALENALSPLKKEHGDRIYLAAVRKDTYEKLQAYLEKKGIPYQVLLPEVMASYSKAHHYRIDNVSFLGEDLFCDVIAPESTDGVIVIDLGTASKVLLLLPDKHFLGASIMPGIPSFPLALNQTTSLLKEKSVLENPPIVSLKTNECISSGAVHGMAAAISGITLRLKREYRIPKAKVYLTGGNSVYVKNELSHYGLKDVIEAPHLVLDGLEKVFSEA